MGKWTIVVACILLYAIGAPAQPVNPQYGWTLSLSNTDPYQNTGPFTPGVLTLYLWYVCVNDPVPGGLAAASMSLTTSDPQNSVLVLAPMNGFQNNGTSTEPYLVSPACSPPTPALPVVVGQVLYLVNTPGQYCLDAGGMLFGFDCNPVLPMPHDIAFIGYSDDGSPPCSTGPDPLCPIPVSLQSFSVE